MLQCFVCSPIPKVREKKGAVGQGFIRKEITTYIIGTLDLLIKSSNGPKLQMKPHPTR